MDRGSGWGGGGVHCDFALAKKKMMALNGGKPQKKTKKKTNKIKQKN